MLFRSGPIGVELTEGMAERYDYGLHFEMLAATCLSLSTL